MTGDLPNAYVNVRRLPAREGKRGGSLRTVTGDLPNAYVKMRCLRRGREIWAVAWSLSCGRSKRVVRTWDESGTLMSARALMATSGDGPGGDSEKRKWARVLPKARQAPHRRPRHEFTHPQKVQPSAPARASLRILTLRFRQLDDALSFWDRLALDSGYDTVGTREEYFLARALRSDLHGSSDGWLRSRIVLGWGGLFSRAVTDRDAR